MAQTQPRGLMPQTLAEYLFYQGYRYIETNRDSGAIVAYNGSELIRAVPFKTYQVQLFLRDKGVLGATFHALEREWKFYDHDACLDYIENNGNQSQLNSLIESGRAEFNPNDIEL